MARRDPSPDFIEALARGLPVISSETGAIPALVGADAGLLVPPGDGQRLQDALRRVLTQPQLLDGLAAGAAAVRRHLPNWQDSCARMSEVLEDSFQQLWRH